MLFWKNNKYLMLYILLMIALHGCKSSPSETTSPIASVSINTQALSINPDTIPFEKSKPSKTPTKFPSLATSQLTETVIPNIISNPPDFLPIGWLVIGNFGQFPDSIDLIHTSGKSWRGIFNNGLHPQNPSWAPNGQWISFTMSRDDNAGSDIYIMRPDGSDLQQLTNTPTYKRAYSWSPNGKSIVFSQTLGEPMSADVDIYEVHLDTQGIHQLTDTPGVFEHNPVYSPNGEIIAYTSIREDDENNNWYLMFMNPDGSDQRMVMETLVGGGKLSWSPDGEQIVFSSADECKDLYIISSDGSDIQQLTDFSGSEISPGWSPGGDWIAFMGTDVCDSGSATGWEIFIIKPDGSGLTQVTNNDHGHPVDPSWYPFPSLEEGNTYKVTESGALLIIHTSPSFESEILMKLEEGDELIVLDGPVESGSYLWWLISIDATGEEGWVAETPGWFLKESEN